MNTVPRTEPTKILILERPNTTSFEQYAGLFSSFGECTADAENLYLNPTKYKLVLFTGGEDVSPYLYGDTSPKGVCGSNPSRDTIETKVFKTCQRMGVPMTGVCRGAQFLNVMCGGKMIHHMNGHGGVNHEVRMLSGDFFVSNSLHHQMMIPNINTHILSWTTERKSDIYLGNKDEEMIWPGPEVEGIYNGIDKVVGVQWHPEMMMPTFRARTFYIEMVRDLMISSTKLGEFEKKYICAPYIKMKRANAMGMVD